MKASKSDPGNGDVLPAKRHAAISPAYGNGRQADHGSRRGAR